MAPELSFLVRRSDGLTLLRGGSPFRENEKIVRLSCSGASFSKDGSKLLLVTPTAVTVYDPRTLVEIRCFSLPGAVTASFSPSGRYVQTFQKFSAEQQKNVAIWDLASGTQALALSHKNFSSAAWPIVQFSEDEKVAVRLAANGAQIYDAEDFSKGVVSHLRLPSLQAVQLSGEPSSHLATYVGESKGQPAVIQVFEVARASLAQHTARRSFFKSSSVKMMWNKGSTGLLALAYSEDDKSNRSYYGECKLHYLTSDGSTEGSVPLSKEGPVHDAKWSPSGQEFVVVYGHMPAKVTLFNTKCRPVFEFGSGAFNTVKWNPFGTFICFAGFGNLPGNMAFWDRNTLKQMGSTKAACSVVCEWSPDGRLLLTATTAPRMQVDNGIKIFKYTGELLEETPMDKLYQAEWKPGKYEERPASPQALKSRPSVALSKPVAYRPPQASNLAAVRAQLLGGAPETPGSEMSKTALRNKKRREKQKEKNEERTEEAVATEHVDETAPVLDETAPVLTGDEASKRLRALKKKLRQIQELKSNPSEKTLTQSQKEKLMQEGALVEEIEKLEKLALL